MTWDLRWGEVDQMAFIGLAIHFPWIWYPSSDDIAIFDDSLAWLLFVDHEGQLAVVWPTAIDAGMDPTTRHVAQAHRYSDVDH